MEQNLVARQRVCFEAVGLALHRRSKAKRLAAWCVAILVICGLNLSADEELSRLSGGLNSRVGPSILHART
jgi:ABC-type nitrate/sulfonate/bicarbonate transport system ATPase subunit